MAKAGERRHQQPLLAEGRPVALGVLNQRVRFRDPQRASTALQPIVDKDAGDLAALARARPIAEHEASAKSDHAVGIFRRGTDLVEGLIDCPGACQLAIMGFARINDGFKLSIGEKAGFDQSLRQERNIARLRWAHRSHGRGLHERRRMGASSIDGH